MRAKIIHKLITDTRNDDEDTNNENRKNAAKINSKEQAKTEAQTEERILMKNPRETLKEEFKDAHAL